MGSTVVQVFPHVNSYYNKDTQNIVAEDGNQKLEQQIEELIFYQNSIIRKQN